MSTYAVRCTEYQTKPVRSRETAEHQLEQIEAAAHCPARHEVIEVDA